MAPTMRVRIVWKGLEVRHQQLDLYKNIDQGQPRTPHTSVCVATASQLGLSG